MRPTDEEIQEKAKDLAFHPVKGHEQHIEDKVLKGMKWLQRQDPWYYTEDGDLPELHRLQKHNYGIDKISEKVFLKVNNGNLSYYTIGHYRLDEDKDGKKYYFEEEPTQTEFDIEEIKAWMHIPQPKR